MSEQELLEIIRVAGRFDIISDGKGGYQCVLVSCCAILIEPESDKESRDYFGNRDD
ncbi:hypothetical protein PO461_07860 [Enterobacter asburiae]|uniref:hypothetical protein n=1 Tax=Enterobacter cloacae complex TaxID=354276 RepID=UPI002FF4C51E